MDQLKHYFSFPVFRSLEPFICGGLSGMFATSCIQPIDTIKVNMQLTGEGSRAKVSLLTTAKRILSQKGFLGMYAGLSAALARQLVYGTLRLGLYRKFTEWATPHDGSALSLPAKLKWSLLAGGLASIAGNPTEVALVRMQGDTLCAPHLRRNYKNVVNAIVRIVREEGVHTLWRGSAPTILRACAMNSSMMSTFDHSKEWLQKHYKDPNVTRFGASVLGGLAAATCTLPFDMLKTRIQQQRPGADGQLPYRNISHAVVKIVRLEGLGALYKGYGAFVFRVCPHAILTLVSMDWLLAGIKTIRDK